MSEARLPVLPVTQLDAQPVGAGEPGAVFAVLYAAYQRAELKEAREAQQGAENESTQQSERLAV